MFDVCCVLLFENPLLGVDQRMINHMSAGSVSLMVVNIMLKNRTEGAKGQSAGRKIFFSKKLLQIAKQAFFFPKT